MDEAETFPTKIGLAPNWGKYMVLVKRVLDGAETMRLAPEISCAHCQLRDAMDSIWFEKSQQLFKTLPGLPVLENTGS